jgi:hypothetical protein
MPIKRIDGLLSERIDSELLVFNQATGEGHALNEAASTVFELCDGETDRAAMLAALARDVALPAEDAVLDLALSELRDAGLIAGDEAAPATNRRAVIRRLGLSVMAAAALPLVDTMLARPAQAQAPCLPDQSMVGQAATTTPPPPTSPTPSPPPPCPPARQ